MVTPGRRMETTSLIDIFCFVLSVPQAIAAALFIADWRGQGRSGRAKMSLFRQFATVLLVVGFGVTCGFGVWLYDHPMKPMTVMVDRPVPTPCPPTQQSTKSASTKGNNSPVVTGNGNKFDNGAIPKSEH